MSTEKKKCPHCGNRRHPDISSMCDPGLTALLKALAAVSERYRLKVNR